MLSLVFIYIVLIFVVLRFSVTVFNFLSNPKLGNYGKHFSDKVSVIIRYSNNSERFIKVLNAFIEQDYRNIEVLILQSGNAELDSRVKNICHTDSRFKIIRSKTLQPDITEGAYLLFIEPDVIIKPGLINSLIYRIRVFNLALLSIYPTQSDKGLNGLLSAPLNYYLLLNLIPLRLVRLLPIPAFSAGSNGCMFFDASVYYSYQWHEKLNHQRPEAADVIKSLKQEGLKVETLLGYRLLSELPCQRSSSLAVNGTHFLKFFGNNSFAAIFYLLLVVAGPVVMLLNYEYSLLILPFSLIFLSRLMISFLSGQNPAWNILLHPVQLIYLSITLICGVYQQIITLVKYKRD